MVNTNGAFKFVENGRSYACRVEGLHRARSEAWWWFGVSGDDARYAPFQVAAGDTPASVRPRVVAYYEDRLARRGGAPWQDRGDTPAAPVVSVAAGVLSDDMPAAT